MRITLTSQCFNSLKEINQDRLQESILFRKRRTLPKNQFEKILKMKTKSSEKTFQKYVEDFKNNQRNSNEENKTELKGIKVKTPEIKISKKFQSFYSDNQSFWSKYRFDFNPLSNSQSSKLLNNYLIPQNEKSKMEYLEKMIKRMNISSLRRKNLNNERTNFYTKVQVLLERKYERIFLKYNQIKEIREEMFQKSSNLYREKISREVGKVEDFRNKFSDGIHFDVIEKSRNNALARKREIISRTLNKNYQLKWHGKSCERLSLPKFRNEKYPPKSLNRKYINK